MVASPSNRSPETKTNENKGYLGLWALLADRKPGNEPRGGHSLARPWDDPTKDEGLAAANSATKGQIVAILDITDMVASTKKMIRKFVG